MPVEPKVDCEALVNFVLPFARQMLNRHGEFYSYGAAMTVNGEITANAGYDGQEHPLPNDVISQLKAAFNAGAKEAAFRATALVYNVRIAVPPSGKETDAIAVSLNHRSGFSAKVLFPYSIEDGRAIIGSAFVQEGESDIFPAG